MEGKTCREVLQMKGDTADATERLMYAKEAGRATICEQGPERRNAGEFVGSGSAWFGGREM